MVPAIIRLSIKHAILPSSRAMIQGGCFVVVWYCIPKRMPCFILLCPRFTMKWWSYVFVASLSPRYGPLRPAPKHLFFLFFSFLFFSFLPSPSSWVTGCYRAIRFHFGWLNRVVLSSSLPLSDTKAVLQCCQAARPLQDSKPGPQLVAARKVLVSSGGHLVCNGSKLR